MREEFSCRRIDDLVLLFDADREIVIRHKGYGPRTLFDPTSILRLLERCQTTSGVDPFEILSQRATRSGAVRGPNPARNIEQKVVRLSHLLETLFRVPVLGSRFDLNWIIDR